MPEKNLKQNLIKPNARLAKNFVADVTKIDISAMPDFDIICAGFPCQPFSQAGFKRGFAEARGTLFFNIAEIIKKKQPKAFFFGECAAYAKT